MYVNVVTLINYYLLFSIQAYGMTALPFSMLKGFKNSKVKPFLFIITKKSVYDRSGPSGA